MNGGCGEASKARLFWYVNGSLEGQELAAVREHVESCATCAREVELLLELSRALEVHDVPLVRDGEVDEETSHAARRPWRSTRFAYGLAAALAVVALVAVGWQVLRPPTPVPSILETTVPSTTTGVSGPLAILDLGGGATRSGGASTVFAPPVGVDVAAVAFTLPPDPEARYRIRIEGPAGVLLDEEVVTLPLDPTGRCYYAVPARLLQAPGAYDLIVTERSPAADGRVFRYPFEVRSGDPGGR